MTAADLPPVPEPEQSHLNGRRRWSWDAEGIVIDTYDSPGRAALIAIDDNGTWLPAQTCREIAAVLLALADESEARR